MFFLIHYIFKVVKCLYWDSGPPSLCPCTFLTVNIISLELIHEIDKYIFVQNWLFFKKDMRNVFFNTLYFQGSKMSLLGLEPETPPPYAFVFVLIVNIIHLSSYMK